MNEIIWNLIILTDEWPKDLNHDKEMTSCLDIQIDYQYT